MTSLPANCKDEDGGDDKVMMTSETVGLKVRMLNLSFDSEENDNDDDDDDDDDDVSIGGVRMKLVFILYSGEDDVTSGGD
ncbi:hypothetical protein Tco_0288379 [Tanacetum coccineum]